MPSITLFAPLNTFSSLGQSVCEIYSALVRQGWKTRVKPLSIIEEFAGQKFPVPLEITEAIDTQEKSDLELLVAPISSMAMPTPDTTTVYWPVIDVGLTPAHASLIGRAEIAIVSSELSESLLQQANITMPMQHIRVGLPKGIFFASPMVKFGKCIFGAGGIPFSPTSRPMLEPVVEAFKTAFTNVSDVELRIYVPFIKDLTRSEDPRIIYETTWKPNLHLCRWYQGLHAFITADVEEGSQRIQQAMACGKPVIGFDHCDITQYPTPNSGKENLVQQLAGQMRRVYIDRNECEKLGNQAATQPKEWTGENLNNLLKGLL